MLKAIYLCSHCSSVIMTTRYTGILPIKPTTCSRCGSHLTSLKHVVLENSKRKKPMSMGWATSVSISDSTSSSVAAPTVSVNEFDHETIEFDENPASYDPIWLHTHPYSDLFPSIDMVYVSRNPLVRFYEVKRTYLNTEDIELRKYLVDIFNALNIKNSSVLRTAFMIAKFNKGVVDDNFYLALLSLVKASKIHYMPILHIDIVEAGLEVDLAKFKTLLSNIRRHPKIPPVNPYELSKAYLTRIAGYFNAPPRVLLLAMDILEQMRYFASALPETMAMLAFYIAARLHGINVSMEKIAYITTGSKTVPSRIRDMTVKVYLS